MVAIHLRPRSTTTATSRSDIVNGWRDWCAEGGMPYRRCHKQDRQGKGKLERFGYSM
jgi:hypothetical protein